MHKYDDDDEVADVLFRLAKEICGIPSFERLMDEAWKAGKQAWKDAPEADKAKAACAAIDAWWKVLRPQIDDELDAAIQSWVDSVAERTV